MLAVDENSPTGQLVVALRDLHGRVHALETSQKTVANSLKGLLELAKAQSADQKEFLDVLKRMSGVDQSLLDQLGQLADRLEQNEKAANLGQAPSRWRAVQAEIDAERPV